MNESAKKWEPVNARSSGCRHPGDDVVADINQGDAVFRHDHSDFKVQWCRCCGAYRLVLEEGRFTEWRQARFGAIK